jgi:hypothetical protein
MLRGAIYVRLSIDDEGDGEGLARPLSHVSAGRADQLIAEDRDRTSSPCRQRHARALNNAALATLIAAASKRKAIVDDDCAKRAIAELTQECAGPSASPPITSAAGAAHTCRWSCATAAATWSSAASAQAATASSTSAPSSKAGWP